ncbi:MAG: hypothetical protein KME11_18795 [Timaviella obliquedivisa GSE-PSE-MK23-08B]|jgi:hypothetical protein|nr:hypothetical protein [Timaviella obliquedivisa GSE-PSE-MK23-08B]
MMFSRSKRFILYKKSNCPSLLVFGLMLTLTACGKPSPTASPTASPNSVDFSSPIPALAEATPSVSPISADSLLISDKAIGAAQLGMTFGNLKKALGTGVEFVVQSPFIVDFDAIAVQRSGEVQYYILYLAKQPFTDADTIQGLLTKNPKFLTAAGIGAGSTLAKAQQAYGKATLSYNTQNESREYARFERQPANNISFATGNGSSKAAGIYASPTGEYNETQKFKEDAKIESVLVVCLTEACAPPSPTSGSPSPTASPTLPTSPPASPNVPSSLPTP